MNYPIGQVIFVGLVISGTILTQFSPLKAHEKKFHIQKQNNQKQNNKVDVLKSNLSRKDDLEGLATPSYKTIKSLKNKEFLNQKSFYLIEKSKRQNHINLIPKAEEVVLLIIISGTFVIYYIKRKKYI
ncbi:MAG: hypothetical protein AAF208_01130 [Cyanobacteria bacterium P01_A01_bin.45]